MKHTVKLAYALSTLILLLGAGFVFGLPAPSRPLTVTRLPVEPAVGRLETLMLSDPERHKSIACRVTYPNPATYACPVVIFSHGALGCKDNYNYLVDYLASAGYVCVQPTHTDSIAHVAKNARIKFARDTLKALPNDSAGWAERARDISIIIDSLPEIQKNIPARMNISKICCAGHSYGAWTTALIAGAEPPPPAVQKSYLDRRVSAAIMMSPQGVRHSRDEFGFANNDAWAHIRVPSLFLTGTRDTTKWTTLKDRQIGFNQSPAGDKYLAVISGAAHMTFTGAGNEVLFSGNGQASWHQGPIRHFLAERLAKTMPDAEGDLSVMTQDICRITGCFLDAYLKNDQKTLRLLNTKNAFGDLVELSER